MQGTPTGLDFVDLVLEGLLGCLGIQTILSGSRIRCAVAKASHSVSLLFPTSRGQRSTMQWRSAGTTIRRLRAF